MKLAGFSFIASGRPLKLISLEDGLNVLSSKKPALENALISRFKHNVLRKILVPYPPLDVFWAVFRARSEL
jgi:hypothetical protein